jgi:AhpC/TSA family
MEKITACPISHQTKRWSYFLAATIVPMSRRMKIGSLRFKLNSKIREFNSINSNDDENYPDDNFDNMVKRAKEKKFNFLYLHDQTQNVAKAYQATHTPHIFVFNQKKELSYTGKIDDNWQNPTQVKRQFLREALSALAQGRDPAEAETFAIGCTIKWKQ